MAINIYSMSASVAGSRSRGQRNVSELCAGEIGDCDCSGVKMKGETLNFMIQNHPLYTAQTSMAMPCQNEDDRESKYTCFGK